MKKNNKSRNKRYLTKIIVSFIVGLAMIGSSVAVFVFSYHNMENTIALEREEYISELTTQVVAKVNATVKQKLIETQNYANLVNQVAPDSFEKVSKIFSNIKSTTEEDKILFLSNNGSVYLFSGLTIRIDDLTFLSEIGSSKIISSAFSPLGTLGDFWLFGSPIDSVVVDGIEMIGIINASKNTTFSEQMTVAMFEKQTYSFLIDDSSNILIKPENALGYGSNLINSLVYGGLSQEDKDQFSFNIKEHKKQSTFFMLNGDKWLIQTAYVQDEYTVALLLPLQITASETINAMNQTVLVVSILLLLSMTSMLFVAVVILKNRAEKRIQQEKFNMELVKKSSQNKADFLSKISHDIRTPLNGIIGMTYLGIKNIDNRSELEDNLSKIQSSADYLQALLNDILDVAKIDSGKMQINFQASNIEDILPAIVTFFDYQKRTKKVTINIFNQSGIKNSYLMDELRVKQILMNLVSNSVKFTPLEGEINLSLKIEPLNELIDNITFIVSDNGVGMSEEFMNRIFNSFEQESSKTSKQYGGSGLGLSIVNSLVNLMEGTIKVDSSLGKGSTFTITLPMKKVDKIKDVTAKENVSLKDKNSNLIGKKVLLAEDHPINAQITTKILEAMGLEVNIAEDGKIALDLFIASNPGYYSIILMDIQMPNMNGFEATKAIRLSKRIDAKTIPIYAMSANSFKEDVGKSLDAGMNGYLKKPIEIPAIKKVIQDCILNSEEKICEVKK